MIPAEDSAMDQMSPSTLHRLVTAVLQEGEHVVAEVAECPHCGGSGAYLHCFAESISCRDCGQRFPSSIPRLPEPGEPQGRHYEEVLEEAAGDNPELVMYIRDRARQLATDGF